VLERGLKCNEVCGRVNKQRACIGGSHTFHQCTYLGYISGANERLEEVPNSQCPSSHKWRHIQGQEYKGIKKKELE
jgi:hypothetical protein